MSKKNKIIFIIILLLGIFIRVYKLYENPSGIHVDEAGMFVDANMLVRYGTDRYNNSFPLYFTNFGGGQSVMYGYIIAALIKIFGCSYLIIRVPSVIFGVILILISYLIGKEFFDKKKALLLMALTSFCPYFIQASRIGLDCNLFLPMFTISLYVLIKSVKKQKNILFFITGILYGLCLYTYAISYLIVPCFLLISLIYLFLNKMINIKQIIILSIPLFLIALPLILFVLVNYNIIKEFKLIIFDFKKLPNFRKSEISIKNIPDNLLMIVNLLSFDFIEYNSIKYFGTVYYIFIPFFITGLISFIKQIKNKKIENLIIINFSTCYLLLLLVSDININKANVIYFSVIYILWYGIINIKSKKIINISIIILIINFLLFSNYYLNNDTTVNAYFDSTIYKVINEEYSILKDKELVIITDTTEKEIFVKMGRIKHKEFIDTQKNKKAYLIKEKMYDDSLYGLKNKIKINDYYLIYE